MPVLTPKFDIANARLRFASGCIANVTASRISRDRVRKIRFFQPDAYLSIDYAAQEVEGWRLVRRDGARPAIRGRPAAGRSATSRCGASWPTSSAPCASGVAPLRRRRRRPPRAGAGDRDCGEDGERVDRLMAMLEG